MQEQTGGVKGWVNKERVQWGKDVHDRQRGMYRIAKMQAKD